ncbi:MAG: lipase family protein [Elainella sp.]
MSKFNRRRMLQAGLAVGTLAAAAGQATAQEAQLGQDEPQDQKQVQKLAQSGSPNPNNPGYDRPLSGLLVRACGLAVAQFLLSQTDQNYDGSINALAEYDTRFNRYRQLASFRAAQLSLAEQASPDADLTADGFTASNLAASNLANKTAPESADPASQVAIRVQEVFFGFALTSDTHHIIALRGTQTEFEWLGNISSRQVNFRNREPQYGRVHRGFQTSQEQIITQVRRTIPQLDPALPLIITGHSLGGAVAMLTAADLALDNSFPARQIRVYTYGSPRVGDSTFAGTYSRLIGQTYRVVNLADTVPMTPPSAFRGDLFQHVGQEWAYLTQLGDTGINHAIETYQTAIDRGVEVSQTRTYPMSAVNCV